MKNKKALHSSLGVAAFLDNYTKMKGNGNIDEYFNEHPILRIHPKTGKKILFVNSMYVKKIIDMDKEESDKILSKVFAHQERLDFTSRCQWIENVLAIWGNRRVIYQV